MKISFDTGSDVPVSSNRLSQHFFNQPFITAKIFTFYVVLQLAQQSIFARVSLEGIEAATSYFLQISFSAPKKMRR